MVCVLVPLGPACVDITGIRAGDQNLIVMSFTSGGAPIDLTGAVVEAQARATPFATEMIEAVIEITDPVGGHVNVRWPGDQVMTMLAGKPVWNGVWDLQVTQGSDDPQTLAAGSFSAVMDVTR